MALPIQDYGIIGDLRTAALVGKDGSIDWLCLPRFDSAACFAGLLGTEHNGTFRIAPAGKVIGTTRRYRPHSLVLETDFETAEGVARVTDCMPLTSTHPRVVRVVEGIRGTVAMEMLMSPRFDYGKTKPWIHKLGEAIEAGAGPSAVELRGHVPLRAHDFHASAEFSIREGEHIGFVLSSHPSWEGMHEPLDAFAAVDQTDAWWREWAGRSTYDGRWAEEVERSLITLKALTFAPTGGIVAAATTSLPEFLGGVRNWDYRFCWLRDAALTLRRADDRRLRRRGDELARLGGPRRRRRPGGHPDHVRARGRAPARRVRAAVPRGYEGSAPVRIGNAASGQLQLDVYGEVIDAIYQAHELGMPPAEHAQTRRSARDPLARGALAGPDDGVWEVRGGRKQFVHSKVMAWVAVDRVLKFARRWSSSRRSTTSRSSRRRCTRRSVARATTRSATRSRSTTGRRSSTHRCS